jgi:uncharacterized repeat protein (TIGR01451 family)
MFQGADGNQADADPLIDWEALDDAGRVAHTSDPNDADSAFAKGKENAPEDWELTTVEGGVSPGKSNILDVWSAYDVKQTNAFLYLGFARADAGGSAFLAFELNHDSRLWNNGHANIPCRRTGDIIISYEPQGNDVSVLLQRWVTSTPDTATGCARTGHLDDLTGLTPNTDAQGALNRAAIEVHLPGFYSESVPNERFGEAALNLTEVLEDAGIGRCFSFGSIWMHSRSSTSDSSNMEDYVAPREAGVRSCSASGTKFHDLNGNGKRDDNEPGLPRWVIWADYNNDGIRDDNEPFGITDSDGHYVINDIRPPRRMYWLRETLLTRGAHRRAESARVACSYPNASTEGGTATAPGGMFRCAWGPIDTSTTTYAGGRDFGNFQAAQLVVKKELEPSTDPGRFNLFVNRALVLPNAGDGANRALMVRPGRYVVSEVAAAGTNAADYESTVGCKLGTRRRQVRAGTVYANVQLLSGERTVCTFRNIRPGVSAIAIDKTGPAKAQAGDTLRYTIYVTNPGDVPFAAASVSVTDPTCDAPPQLTGKTDGSGSDDSPGTLDPGDTWTYACSRKTTAPPDCTAHVVTNTANVTATTGGASVGDHVTIETDLLCPPKPPEPGPGPGPQPPEPQPPTPQPPDPLVPPGPKPPDSGDAAHAGFILRQATAGCIRTRVPRVNFHGTRIARIRVYVNGRLRRRLTVESLQRRLTPRVQLAPGRYRLSVRVTFDRGTGSPPVTLTRRIRICGVLAARPPFTG